jgi:hypothetical protein
VKGPISRSVAKKRVLLILLLKLFVGAATVLKVLKK